MKRLLLLVLLFLGACTTSTPNPIPTPDPNIQPEPTAIGTPVGEVASKTIGAAGGSLSSADGKISLTIPAGALSEDKTITIQEITDELKGGLKAYRFTPDGLQFATPARLEFHYDETTFEGSAPEATGIAFQTSQRMWTDAGNVTVDAATRTLRVDIPHFSDWAFYEQWYITPTQAEVKVGGTLQLTVYRRAPKETCSPKNSEPLPDCLIPMPDTLYKVTQWDVNGVPGGGVHGILTGSEQYNARVTYNAPKNIPSPNPVTVKATIDLSKQGKGLLYLLASIKVLPAESTWQGTITYSESGSRDWKMVDGFVGSGQETFKHTRTYKVVGVKAVDGPSTTLLLEETSNAEYTNNGHMEKKIYEICQAFGPVILRHHFDYAVAEQLTGTVTRTLEARLYMGDGTYNLYLDDENFEIKGERKVTDVYKDGCAETTNDRSHARPVTTHAGTDGGMKVEGTLDPKNPNLLKGGYDAEGEDYTLPTAVRVEWNITKN
jgi:hypothetical protein